MHRLALLAAAGLLAGTMNAIAGGGSFASFPAMVFAGLPAITANASSTVALFPGTMTSAWAYRSGFVQVGEIRMRLMLPVTVAGGLCGALLLLHTPGHLFDLVIPWLLLLATFTFAFGDRIRAAFEHRLRVGPAALLTVQFVISIYGGYFGGAVGLMMLAAWALLTERFDAKTMAPVRTILISAANAAAVILFIASGIVRWPETLAVLAGAVAGGYGGAQAGRRLPRGVIRAFVLLLTASITAVFFCRAF